VEDTTDAPPKAQLSQVQDRTPIQARCRVGRSPAYASLLAAVDGWPEVRWDLGKESRQGYPEEDATYFLRLVWLAMHSHLPS
jgi:hypothetical protein